METNRMSFITPHSNSNSAIANFFSVRDRLPIVWMGKSTHHRVFFLVHCSTTVLKILYLIHPLPLKPPCNYTICKVFLSYQLLTVA